MPEANLNLTQQESVGYDEANITCSTWAGADLFRVSFTRTDERGMDKTDLKERDCSHEYAVTTGLFDSFSVRKNKSSEKERNKVPELPEVEIVCREMRQALLTQTIQKVEVRKRRLRFLIPPAFEKNLEHLTISSLQRRAKYILVGFQGLLIHS
jgi:hypothetical protein